MPAASNSLWRAHDLLQLLLIDDENVVDNRQRLYRYGFPFHHLECSLCQRTSTPARDYFQARPGLGATAADWIADSRPGFFYTAASFSLEMQHARRWCFQERFPGVAERGQSSAIQSAVVRTPANVHDRRSLHITGERSQQGAVCKTGVETKQVSKTPGMSLQRAMARGAEQHHLDAASHRQSKMCKSTTCAWRGLCKLLSAGVDTHLRVGRLPNSAHAPKCADGNLRRANQWQSVGPANGADV